MDDINYLHEKINKLEKDYSIPEFTRFEIRNTKLTYEVGESFPSQSSPNVVTFEWETTAPDSVKEDSVQIKNMLTDTVIGKALPNNGLFNVSMQEVFTFISPNSFKFKISAEALNGTILEKEIELQWVDKVFWGISPSKTITTDQLNTFSSFLFNSTAENQKRIINSRKSPQHYKVIATPRRYPINKIVDKHTSLDFIFDDPYELTMKNQFNLEIPYLVYVSSYQVSSPVDLIVKFGEEENGD